jgi:CheY-like chemotaxis protein
MLRVLVVDDCADNTASLAMLLTLWGYDVRAANAGAAAVTLAAAYRPDVVFLDLVMPEMDGFETARRLRELPATREVLLVALTGLGGERTRQRAREAGFDLYLIKPLGVEELEEVLASCAPSVTVGA